MDMLSQSLPIVIYFLLIVLLIVLIVIGIKLITTMNKVDKIVDDINEKVESLNGLFSAVDYITDKIARFGDSVVSIFTGSLMGWFKKSKKKESVKDE